MSISKFLIFTSICFLLTVSLTHAQRKDTSDYFAIGLFFGNHNSSLPSHNLEIINSAGLELEYYKFTDLSFFVQGLYTFSGNGHNRGPHPNDFPESGFPGKNFDVGQLLGVNIGGKYFLRSKSVNPFFELGLNQNFRLGGGGNHRKPDYIYDDSFNQIVRNTNSYNVSLSAGAGLSFKVDSKFKLELKYNLFQNLSGKGGTGYALLAGGKYNL